MKKLLLIMSILLTYSVDAQIVNFPDANFKNALVNTNCVDTDDDGIPDADVDINNNGVIEVSEAEMPSNLYLTYRNIGLLEGIQYFTNIEILKCDLNYIYNNLDVSQNIKLKYLNCTNNNLRSITLGNNLEIINCSENWIENIDLSGNASLREFDAGYNFLTSLDVTHNTNLEVLLCNSNDISALDVTQNPNLEILLCSGNEITSMDVTQNPNLRDLRINVNEIGSINLSQNQDLEVLNCSNNNLVNLDVSQNLVLNTISCGVNSIYNLDVSPHVFLTEFSCQNNELINLNVRNGNNPILTSMYASGNPNLNCIEVDNVFHSNNYPSWYKDPGASYSVECVLNTPDVDAKYDISIFPNPTEDLLNIQSKTPVENVMIYSIQGVLVKEVTTNNVDVSDLSAGFYFVILSVDGKDISKKFIKN